MIYLIIYIISAILTYGMAFADAQKRFPNTAKQYYKEDMGVSILFALLSPISTIILFLITGFAQNGLKFK